MTGIYGIIVYGRKKFGSNANPPFYTKFFQKKKIITFKSSNLLIIFRVLLSTIRSLLFDYFFKMPLENISLFH